MQDLTVTGVENGALLLSSEDGTRFRAELSDDIRARLRRAPTAERDETERRTPPREIQAHIRAGMSAEDVAELTGSTLEYVLRFEGPVMAEREFVVESALGVGVHTPSDADGVGSTFGGVIRSRLADGGAVSERWASWKDPESGWIVKLTFEAEHVEHDARWAFDPRKQSLAPLNSEAIALSQQGEVPPSLIPRLRAVPIDGSERTRFDSGAFQVEDAFDAADAAVAPVSMNQTADLLEALRRRRGERDSRPFDEAPDEDRPLAPSIRLVDVPLAGMEPEDSGRDAYPNTAELPQDLVATPDEEPDYSIDDASYGDDAFRDQQFRDSGPQPSMSGARRKGRTTMPSWDEIVFGARTDED